MLIFSMYVREGVIFKLVGIVSRMSSYRAIDVEVEGSELSDIVVCSATRRACTRFLAY